MISYITEFRSDEDSLMDHFDSMIHNHDKDSTLSFEHLLFVKKDITISEDLSLFLENLSSTGYPLKIIKEEYFFCEILKYISPMSKLVMVFPHENILCNHYNMTETIFEDQTLNISDDYRIHFPGCYLMRDHNNQLQIQGSVTLADLFTVNFLKNFNHDNPGFPKYMNSGKLKLAFNYDFISLSDYSLENFSGI